MALVSSKVRTFQEGYQLGGAVVLLYCCWWWGRWPGCFISASRWWRECVEAWERTWA